MCGVTAGLTVGAYFAFFWAMMNIPGLWDPLDPYAGQDLLGSLIDAGPKGWLLLLAAAMTGYAIAALYRAWFLNLSFGSTMVRLHDLRSKVNVPRLIWINVTNLLLMLYYPFAKVRLVRYQLSRMHLEGSGKFEDFLAGESPDTGALGEEAGDFFNVDLGL
jgi:uncharacterized membrane protein YjgN (DUF898 family)